MSQRAPHPTFVEFLEHGVELELTVPERALLRVGVDGVEPRDLPEAERAPARQMFGAIDVVPPLARAVLVIVGGARWGKTYFGALYSLWRALFADLATLAPGQMPVALHVAPDMRLARLGLRYVAGAINAHRHLRRYLKRETADALELARPDKRPASIEALPATHGGSATRGRDFLSADLDEAAFMRDGDYRVNAAELFEAVSPRVMPGGLVLVKGTPFAEKGLLFDLFSENHGNPTTALAAHCPTLLMYPSARNLAAVERERLRDPENARREFDAEFMPAGSGLLFDTAALRACVDPSLPLRLPPTRGRVAAGFDFGPVHDATAGAVVRFDPDGRLECAETFERRPAKGAPLVPSVVVRDFCRVALAHGARQVFADQFYAASIAEHVTAAGLSFVPAPGGNAGVVLVANTVRELVHSGRVVIPAAQRDLVAQLSELAIRPLSGGGFTLHSPRRPGSHGDIARAWMLAVFALARARTGTVSKCEVSSLGVANDLAEGGF